MALAAAALPLVVLLAAAPSRAGGVGAIDAPHPIVERSLDGTALVFVSHRGAARAAVRVVVHVGGDDDPPGRAGLADMTAHAVLQGTYDMQHGALFRLADRAGGALGVEVTPDATVFSLDVPSAGAIEVLAPLLKTVTAPALPFVDLERVRLIAGATDVEQAPLSRAGWAARQVAFPSGHGGLVLIGSAETRRGVTIDEVTSFYQRHYLPARLTVIVVGDVDEEELRRTVDRGLHGAPLLAPPRETERRRANVPSEASGKGRRTLAVSAAVIDGEPDAGCFAAARVLELRLRRHLGRGDATMETHVGCDAAFGHALVTVAARSSSPAASTLPEAVREVRRTARSRKVTAGERSQVAALVVDAHRSALATPAGLAALLLAAARGGTPLEQAAAPALRPPRLDWQGAAQVLAAVGDDRRAVEVAFSPFTR